MTLSENERDFLDAAFVGDLEKIKKLTTRGWFGKKALISLENHDEIVTWTGDTALVSACWKGHSDVVRFLIQENSTGIDVNRAGDTDDTPLHPASNQGHVEIMELLIEKGANINQQDRDGETPLHKAIYKGQLSAVKLLLEKGADLHIQTIYDETPLNLAMRQSCYDVASELVKKGARVNQQNEYGRTPLHEASCMGELSLMKLLLEMGADPLIKDKYNVTALDDALERAERFEDDAAANVIRQHIQRKDETTAANQQTSILPSSPPQNNANSTNQPIHHYDENESSRNLLQNAINHPESSDDISDLSSDYILQCTQNLERNNFLGGGTFGNVHLATDANLSTSKFAVKVFDLSNIVNAKHVKQLICSYKTEAATLKRFRHPNIITLYGTCNLQDAQGEKFALVMEYANKGSLDSFLKDDANRARLTADIRVSIMFQLARSIHFLHTGGQGGVDKVFHRDIKPSNICLTNNFQVKLIDCGLAKLVEDPSATESQFGSLKLTFMKTGYHGPVGTPGYMCPIYEHTQNYVEGSDVFSLGVVFAELIVGCLQGGQAEKNGKLFGLIYDTYVWDHSEYEPIVDGGEQLVKDADTVIVWNPDMLETISKIAIKCMAPSMKKRKKTLDLVNELNRILGQTLLERATTSDDDNHDSDGATVNEADPDDSPDIANLSIGSRTADESANANAVDASPCWLCNRNMTNKLKCSEGHEICGSCAGEYILNHFGQGDPTDSSSSSIFFGCCISGCKSKPFSDEDMCRILSPSALTVYNMKRNHNEQLRLLKEIRQELSQVKSGVQGISNQLTRSVMALSALTVGGSDLCPNLVWMVPSNEAKFRQDPKKWFLQKTIKQTYKVVFVCQHSWESAHAPFEINVPRDWIVKVAPLLEVGLTVFKAAAVSQELPFPDLEMAKFRQNVQAMKELVDSVIPESEKARIANAIRNAGDGQTQQDVLTKEGDICNLVGEGLKWLNEKANKTKNLQKWSGKIVAVPNRRREEADGGLRFGAIKWVKEEYTSIYLKE